MPQREHRLLLLHRRLGVLPFGPWLFARAVCWQAPYFASIAPRIEVLEPGRCDVSIRDRRRVHNHLGTVHAIALCNMAELAGGLCTEVSIPASMRWIPKRMTVSYLVRASGRLRAVARHPQAPSERDAGYPLPVDVEVTDGAGKAVLRALIEMWISPRPKRP